MFSRTPRFVWIATTTAALVVAWLSGLPASEPTSQKPRLLYLTHTAGFVHDVLPVSEEVLGKLSADSRFDLTVTKDTAAISKDRLTGYSVVIFNTTGELPLDAAQKDALLTFVRSGHGFVGVHSATDTFYKWPEYGAMIGGYFDQHPWHQEVQIKVEDQSHPSTSHLPASFTIRDEIYQFRDWSRDRVHVLLSLDATSVDLTKPNVHRTDRDFAVSWTREEGKGRVFYTSLGHEAAVWRDPRFQQHLMGGIRWAGGIK